VDFLEAFGAKKSEVADTLRLDSIRAAYAKRDVLRGVTLSVKRGEILALIGPNGAGKSSILKVVAGFLKPLSGSVNFNGVEIGSLEAHHRIRLGIGYLMQGGRVFPSLSSLENLETSSLTLLAKDRAKSIADALETFPNLKPLLKKRAGLLSGGERQSLALAMVFVKRTGLLLLDEPSAGLSPRLVRDLLAKVRELSNLSDVSILLVEQNIREALTVADRAMAIVNGEVALETSSPRQWLTGHELEQLFLGRTHKSAV
jgi:ABC-type branched-subunit amino acid transport system ATPase component